MNLQQSLVQEFESLLGASVHFPQEYKVALAPLCEHLEAHALRTPTERQARLIAHINSKFNVNRDGIAKVYAHAASRGLVFNFHEKNLIQAAFDSGDQSAFEEAISKASSKEGLVDALCRLFAPASPAETISYFRGEVEAPSKLRAEQGDRAIGNEALLSAFSAFVFSAADQEVLHSYFDSTYSAETYERAFWLQLRQLHPQLYSRERTLDIAKIDQELADSCGSLEELRSAVFAHVSTSYQELENHGHLAYWIEPIVVEGRNITWEICSDIMLFAEKHDEVKLKNAYFRAKQIESETVSHVPDVDVGQARFDLANEGFTYKDTFVCAPSPTSPAGSESLLLLFQKNKRDETIIPCPACRTRDVHGNSYSSLGVRSWECRNSLCPDRSKYNRGKRYSFKAILMQEAIDEVESYIPPESVRKWSRDVQTERTIYDATEMLIRHYSLHGDGVALFGVDAPSDSLGRRFLSHGRINTADGNSSAGFFESPWFQRYALPSSAQESKENASSTTIQRLGSLTMVCGNSAMVLQDWPENYFDGAVTSPPYFNAREYSQWPNIYCYLRDMLIIAQGCYKALKPGAVYLYNIFDYFDNERSVVFSAMGDKRLILSAYTVDIFRRAGFHLSGSITWDKGDIEGKRGFNAGNFSPYYQAPFNCWEHVLVFVKPPAVETTDLSSALPAILRAQPVIKMVKGQNTYGHTAPFPIELPNLLRALMPKGGRALDPFGGSGTTARALDGYAAETVCIEQKEEYFELALKLFDSHRMATTNVAT
ncbi:site-specific DNA-methyltransferase [Pseudoduganella sp. FT55W]|uniref:site-specific DNA-methyltransferase (cytosine-N(4)-specific) n=1 Tax=Duganella rivi TaxID=2666083 RepID=A0A7X4GMJ9_9BURK|nr:site-specific DNA-methyltransferase [Duganella rivi]MYM66238.1 site-specific DNA-methyltransferase [Duganella rivi]